MSEVNMTTKVEQANELVKNYVIASMGAALVPIPIFDLVALTGIQLKMLHSLSLVYHVEYIANLSKSLIASLLSGLVLTRAGATLASLAKTMPGIGTATSIIGVSIIGGASSYAIGKVFIQHFESGGTFLTFDPEQVREYFAREFEHGKQVVTELNSKKGCCSPKSSTTQVETCTAIASAEIPLPVTTFAEVETSIAAVETPLSVTISSAKANVETSVSSIETPLSVTISTTETEETSLAPVEIPPSAVINPSIEAQMEMSVAPVEIPLPADEPIAAAKKVAPVEIPPPVITASAAAVIENMETSVAPVATPIAVAIDSTSPPISEVEESEMTTKPADLFSTTSSLGNENPPGMTIDFSKREQPPGTLANLIRSAISVTAAAPQTIFSTPSPAEAIIPPTATEVSAAVAPVTTDSNLNVDQLTTRPSPTSMEETVVAPSAAGGSDSAAAVVTTAVPSTLPESSTETTTQTEAEKEDSDTTAPLSQLRPKSFWFMK